jgi:hypothetical protein
MTEGSTGDTDGTEIGEGEALRTSFGVPSGIRRVFAPTDGSTRIVLIRHGEAVCNVNGIVGGERGCTGLTDLGRRQVVALAERLSRTGELEGATARRSPAVSTALGKVEA